MCKTWGRIRIRIWGRHQNGKSDPDQDRHQYDAEYWLVGIIFFFAPFKKTPLRLPVPTLIPTYFLYIRNCRSKFDPRVGNNPFQFRPQYPVRYFLTDIFKNYYPNGCF